MNQTTFQTSNASAQGRGRETNASKNDPQPSHFGTQYPDSGRYALNKYGTPAGGSLSHRSVD